MVKTNFNNVVVDSLEAKNGLIGAVSLSKSDSYALADGEKKVYIGITMSAASKVLTLGLAEGQIAFVKNEGATNAVTVKNNSGDTGVSLAAGKIGLAKGGTSTANTFTLDVLN